ncbi:MAG: hypothetical protein IT323_11310 [Anaerolineae bacterium]|nr:hypothetical protein [Anaerolineae bacterium]
MNAAPLILIPLGLALVYVSLRSMVQTFVLPRSARDGIVTAVARALLGLFRGVLHLRGVETYEQRDRLMAFYAPVLLLVLPPVYLALISVGYTLIYLSLGYGDFTASFELSGSSLLTLGVMSANSSLLITAIMFTEATIGLTVIAVLIAYIPTMYGAFSRRETLVALLEVRAGSPPSAVQMIERMQRLERLERLHDIWPVWEQWFAELEETHTSLVALVFFRSPQASRSWITAAGTVLDAAALVASTLDIKREVNAEICIRAGYLALRKIADYFQIAYDPNPGRNDPVSISQAEFDQVYDDLLAVGIALKPDRQQCWEDFAGWRVNYDRVLLSLAALTMAPYAPWISDRSALGLRQRAR